MTVGPWKPIKLETYQNRIADMYIRTQVSEELDVRLSVSFKISEDAPVRTSVVLKKPDGAVESHLQGTSLTGSETLQLQWDPDHIDLWYPVGYGAQPLYTFELELIANVSYCLQDLIHLL